MYLLNQNKCLMECFCGVHSVHMLSGNRGDKHTQNNIDMLSFENVFYEEPWTTEMYVVQLCNIHAEMKGNTLMEKEFTTFYCKGRIWINLAPIQWSWYLYFLKKIRSGVLFSHFKKIWNLPFWGRVWIQPLWLVSPAAVKCNKQNQ